MPPAKTANDNCDVSRVWGANVGDSESSKRHISDFVITDRKSLGFRSRKTAAIRLGGPLASRIVQRLSILRREAATRVFPGSPEVAFVRLTKTPVITNAPSVSLDLPILLAGECEGVEIHPNATNRAAKGSKNQRRAVPGHTDRGANRSPPLPNRRPMSCVPVGLPYQT